MTEPLSFIHRDYSIFTNNENDLIMKRLYLGVFFLFADYSHQLLYGKYLIL